MTPQNLWCFLVLCLESTWTWRQHMMDISDPCNQNVKSTDSPFEVIFPHLWLARRSGINVMLSIMVLLWFSHRCLPPEEPEDEEGRGLLQLFLSPDEKRWFRRGKLLPKQPCRLNSGSLVEARRFSHTEETNLSKDLITDDTICCFLMDFWDFYE